MDPDNVFTKGVWLFTSESGAGTYYVFTDENTGHTERDDGTGGIPFACEQDGWDIIFHFGGADDTTKAVVAPGEASITFTYEDGATATYTVEYIDGADPDTFDIDDFGFVPEELYNFDGMDVSAVSDKGSPDTGAADVAVVAGLGILAAGAVIVAKKKK